MLYFIYITPQTGYLTKIKSLQNYILSEYSWCEHDYLNSVRVGNLSGRKRIEGNCICMYTYSSSIGKFPNNTEVPELSIIITSIQRPTTPIRYRTYSIINTGRSVRCFSGVWFTHFRLILSPLLHYINDYHRGRGENHRAYDNRVSVAIR